MKMVTATIITIRRMWRVAEDFNIIAILMTILPQCTLLIWKVDHTAKIGITKLLFLSHSPDTFFLRTLRKLCVTKQVVPWVLFIVRSEMLLDF